MAANAATRRSSTVVIDTGSYSCKAGLTGHDSPSVIVPTLTGQDRRTSSGHSTSANLLGTDPDGYSLYCVGDEAFSKRGCLDISYPVQNGVITNWEGVEKIWRHIFEKELRIESKGSSVLLAEPPLSQAATRSKMTQIMFEMFQISELYIANTSCLSLYASGVTTGTVLDCGEGVTHAVTVYEGYVLPHAVQRAEFGGRDLTDYLMRLLNSSSGQRPSFSSVGDYAIVRDIKEKHCCVPLVKDSKESSSQNDNYYVLPDGSEVRLTDEQIQCGEILFNPSLCGASAIPPLPDMVVQSINKTDTDINNRDLYRNIVVSGGTTCLPGLPERLKKEITARVSGSGSLSQEGRIRILSPDNRWHSAWYGGSILGSSEYRSMWVSRAEYEDSGPDIVHRKCY